MDDDFEVKGEHEAAVEHAAEKKLTLGQEVAMFSAVIATLGAIVSFLGSHTQNEALYYKNEAVLMKARASDSWTYYQANSVKLHLAEQGQAMIPAQAQKYEAAIAKYTALSKTLKAEAEEYDHKSEEADRESQSALHPHNKLAISMTALQIAIALASITALTRRGWLLGAAALFAAVGITLVAMAWL